MLTEVLLSVAYVPSHAVDCVTCNGVTLAFMKMYGSDSYHDVWPSLEFHDTPIRWHFPDLWFVPVP